MDLLNTILLINLPPQFQMVLITLVGIIGIHVILSTVLGLSPVISLIVTFIITGGIFGLIYYSSMNSKPMPPRF